MLKAEERIIISNSGVECAQTCPTKYYWRYERRYVLGNPGDEAPLGFGKAVHKGLELRGQGSPLNESVEGFDTLFPADLTVKHTIKAGHLILKDYYERYEKEEVTIIENEYKFLIDLDNCLYRGVLDKLVQTSSGVMVLDHKTTSRLGSNFYESTKPNGQFTGYIYAADCEFNDVSNLIVDGILVPYPYKTKQLVTDFQRVETSRTQLELELWADNVKHIVGQIYGWREKKFFPKYDKGFNCSNNWGGCEYRELCLMPSHAYDIDPPKDLYKKRKTSDKDKFHSQRKTGNSN